MDTSQIFGFGQPATKDQIADAEKALRLFSTIKHYPKELESYLAEAVYWIEKVNANGATFHALKAPPKAPSRGEVDLMWAFKLSLPKSKQRVGVFTTFCELLIKRYG